MSNNKVATAFLASLVCLIAFAFSAAAANASFDVTAFKMQPQTPASTSSAYQAAGHPSVKFNIDPNATLADGSNGDDLKKVTYEFPAGALGNPQATELGDPYGPTDPVTGKPKSPTTKCVDDTTQFQADKCPAASYIGSLAVPLRYRTIFGTYATINATGSMYIMADPPTSGSAITVGFIIRPGSGYRWFLMKTEVTGVVSVRTGLDADYGLTLTVDNIPRTIQTTTGSNLNVTISNITATLNNKANTTASGPYFTYMPTRCDISKVRATMVSYAGVMVQKADSWTATGCSSVPFTPTATVTPDNTTGSAPVNWTANFTNTTTNTTMSPGEIKTITTDLPAGTQLNTTAISSIPATCDEAALNSDTCPPGSKIGTASAMVPLLANPNGGKTSTTPNFKGDVYVLSKVNGITFAYIVRGPNGIKAMTRGYVAPVDTNGDGAADFIRAYSENMPQAPFSPAQIVFNTGLVKNAAACGVQTIKTTITSWTGASWTGNNTYNISVCGPVVPTITQTGGPVGGSTIKQNQPTWTFSANPSAGSTFQANLDNAGYVAFSGSSYTPASPLSEGSHNLKVRACNSASPPGCSTTVVDITFTVDTVPPTLNITSPAANALLNTTTVPVAFNVESGSTATCAIDGGAASACAPPSKTYSALSQGPHTVTIVATDGATNTTTKSVTFTVDTVAPTTVPTCSPSGNSASCAFSFGETVSGVTCSLAGPTPSASAPCSSPVSYSGLANGNYTFTVVGTDAAGNVGTGTTTFSITVDTTPPNTTIVTKPANPTNATSASFTYSSSEPNGTFECSLDGAPQTVCATSGISYTGLADGSHTFNVKARDNATNIDPVGASYTWVVDTAAPAAPTCASVPALTASTSVTLSCTGESGATLQYQRDGGTWTTFTSPVTLTAFTNGSHTIGVRQIDAAGNTGSALSITFTVDNVAPDTTVTGPSGTVGSTSASISFSSTEAGSTFQCSQDGAAYGNCTSPVTLTALSQGAHTFAVRATDAAGNTDTSAAQLNWVVDTVGPAAPTISGGPTGTVNTASASFTITPAESGGTLQASLDGGSYVAATSPFTLSGLADGSHQVCFRQLDAVGNVGASACRSWTVDTTPPPVPTGTGPSGTITVNSATITFSDSESGVTFECSKDGAAYAACTSPVSLTGLSEGAHTYAVRAKDAVGNTSASLNFNWIVSTIGPPPPSVTSPTGTVSSTSATITFTDTQAGVTFECSQDGAAFAACTSPVSLTGLGQGAHTFAVRAKDTNGLYSGATTNTWTVDTIAPPAPNVSGPSGTVASTSASITFTDTESGVTFECSQDGGAYAACTSPKALTGLAQGAHSYAVRAKDAAGNTSTSSTINWSVDTVAPPVPSVSGPSGTVASQSASITFSDSESGVSFECSQDGGAYAACTSPVSLSSLAQGAHSYAVRAKDAVGNTSASTTINWTVDTVAPPTPSVSGPTGLVASTSANITFSDTEAGVTFECSTDGAAYVACTSPVSLSSLAQGAHTFAVRAKDAVGNTSGSANLAWTVDTIAPPAPSVSGPSGTVASTSANITFSDTEAGVTFECSQDGGAYAACTSPKALTGLTQGAHSYAVRAKDAAGNTSTSTTINWNVNVTPPPAPTVSGPTGTVASTSASITFSDTQSGVTFECSQDGGAYAACTSPVSLTGLSQGAHSFAVRALDAQLNTSTSTTINWSVDTVGPPAPSVSGPTGTVASTSASITFTDTESPVTFECSLDGGAFAACTSPQSLTGLAQGAHSYAVRAKDALGNVGSSSSIAWTVDTVAPPVPSVSGPSGTVASTSANITFSDTEAGVTFECSQDAGAYAACTSPKALTGLAQGAHSYAVRAKDAVGNTSASTTINWTVDTVAPPVPSVSGPSGTVAIASQNVTFSDTEAGVTFECSFNGAAYSACTTPQTVTSVAGANSFAVRAKDAVGNTSASTTINWTYDSSGFSVSITAGPTGTVNTSTNSFSFVASITSGTTYQCKVDGGAFASCTSPFSTGALADGSHTFTVHATNGSNTTPDVSRTWTVDATPPVVTISAPTGTTGPSVTLTFTATDTTSPPVSTTCKLDGGTATSCTSGQTYSGLSNGSHTITVTGTDGATNTTVQQTTWTVDAVGPNAPTLTAPSGTVASTSATISWTGAEAGGTYQCSQDGGAYATCTSPVSLSSLTQGSHSFAVRQIDAFGNVGTSATATWTVDTVAPPAPNVSGPSGTVASTSANITFTDTEAGVTFECSQDGGAYAACTSPKALTGLAQGAHSYAVRAKDAVGNTSASTTINWSVDTVAPPTPSISGPTGTVASTSASITFSDTEAGVTFECSQDGGAFATCTSPVSLSGLAQGAHTYAVRAKDAVGNTSGNASLSWTVDTVAPPVPSVSGPSGTVASNSANITFSDTEAGVTFECSQDGGAYAACTSPVSLSSLAQGAHSYAVRAKDAVGNTSASTTINWTVDTVAPPVPTISGPSGTVASTSASITFSDTESGVTFECSQDGGAFATCTSPVSLSGLAQGAHTYTVRAKDAVGNTSASATALSWTVDTVAPPVPSVSGPSGTVASTSANITFTDTEAGVTFECSQDGGAYAACTSPKALTGLAQGAHSYAVRAKDAVGNTSASTTINWTVDTVAPPVPTLSGPSGTVASTSASITLSDTEAGVSYECSQDGGAFAACTSPVSLTGLSQGAHTFTARAKDAVGNTSAAATALSWTVDTVGPPAPSVSGPSGTVGTTSATITFSDTESPVTFECSLDGAAFAACTSPVNLTGLSQTTHTFAVRAKDAVGNAGSSTTISWTVNTTPPPAPTVSGPTGTVASTSASITFSDTQSGVTFECSQDGGAYAACTSPVSLTGLSQGAHSYAVRAKDSFGNTSTSTTINWTVDTVAPPVPSVSGPSGTVASTSANITFSDTEAGVTFECSQDAGAYAACTSPKALTGLAQGAHSYAVRAKDAVGNTSGSTTINWTVDTVGPNAPTLTAPSGTVASTSATISWTGAEAGGTYQCSQDGGAFATCTSPVNLTGLAQGGHTFAVRQLDSVSNIGSAATASWTVDTLAPPVPSVSGPSGTVASTSANITFSDTEAGVTFECSQDGGAYAACTSPKALTGLAQGAHSYAVRAKDAVGNTSASTTINWTVDTVAPPVPTGTGPSGTVSVAAQAITFSDTEAGVTFECSFNGAAFTTCTSPQNVTSISGANTFNVRAKDAVGNTSASLPFSWNYVASVAPDTILDQAASVSPTATPTILVSSSLSGSTFQCQVNDNGTWTTCDPNVGDYGSLPFLVAGTDATGTNKVSIRATKSGTPDPTPVITYVWVDDRSPHADATVTPSTTAAGAHPNLDASISLDGGYNPRSVNIKSPLGLNGALTATSEKCDVNDALSGLCATNAPQSYIGTLTGEGLSTRDGYLTGVSGNLYLTTPPDTDTPAGVALDMLAPNGLGHIWAVGNVKIVQSENGNINGETRVVIDIQNIPQRTSDLGNPFHVVKAALHLLADPDNNPSTFPLLTNPSTCPATPDQFDGTGTVYGDPNDDGSIGPDLVPDHTYVDYPVTACNALEFSPTVTQQFFMPTPIDGSTYDPTNPAPSLQNVGTALTSNRTGYRKGQAGTLADLDTGASNYTAATRRATIQNTVVYMPVSIGANLPAFGDVNDMCPGGSASASTVFDPSQCPAIALVGTITASTPLLADPLVGNVYAINKTPIPWIGIDINPSTGPNNPAGVILHLTGTTDTSPYPGCSASGVPWCGNRVKITLSNLPDVPLNHVTLDLSGRTARPTRAVANDGGPAGGSLSTLSLITADGGDSGCKPNDNIISQFSANPDSGVTSLERTQAETMSFCTPPDLSALSWQYTRQDTGAVASGNPSTTNTTPSITWTSTEVGASVSCQIDSGSFTPCSSPWTPTVAVDGSHQFTVRLINAAGTDENKRTVSFTTKGATLPPTPTVTRSSSTAGANQIFAWTRGTGWTTAIGGTLQCKRDAGAFTTSATSAACGTGFGTNTISGTATTGSWTTGVSHTYTVRVVDSVGNVTPTAAVTWAN